MSKEVNFDVKTDNLEEVDGGDWHSVVSKRKQHQKKREQKKEVQKSKETCHDFIQNNASTLDFGCYKNWIESQADDDVSKKIALQIEAFYYVIALAPQHPQFISLARTILTKKYYPENVSLESGTWTPYNAVCWFSMGTDHALIEQLVTLLQEFGFDPNTKNSKKETAVQSLQVAFDKGKINEAEYNHRKSLLK